LLHFRRTLLHSRSLALGLCVSLLAMQSPLLAASAVGESQRAGTAESSSNPTDLDLLLRAKATKRWREIGFHTRLLSVNGTKLFVAEAGTGPSLLLLHGYPESGEEWRRVATQMTRSHHVIVPDLRGMGLSDVTSGDYDLATVAEDLHQLVQVLAVSNPAVVGHDWGGSVAVMYALRYRDEVTRLAFIESALPGAGFEQLWSFVKPNQPFTFIPFLLMGDGSDTVDITVDLLRGREQQLLHYLWAGFTSDKQAAPFEKWRPYVAAMRRPGLIASSASYYRAVYRSADEVKPLLAVSPLTIPVLSVAGERSIGANQDGLVHAFASHVIRSVVIPGAGHFVPEERTDVLVTELTTFLK
jgi:pimeloyl-ACP methyl ester carboxylesterase